MATMQQQTMVIIRLRASDDIEGIGEATTIGGLSYGEESPEGIKLTIDTYLAPVLVGQDATNINDVMLKLNKAARGNRFAKSGIETALLDAQGAPVAIIEAAAVSQGEAGMISGVGLASAMISGFAAICSKSSGFSTPAAGKPSAWRWRWPTNPSAPFMRAT